MKEISQEIIDALAASLIDDILKDFKDPEVQKRFEIWKKKRVSLCSQD